MKLSCFPFHDERENMKIIFLPNRKRIENTQLMRIIFSPAPSPTTQIRTTSKGWPPPLLSSYSPVKKFDQQNQDSDFITSGGAVFNRFNFLNFESLDAELEQIQSTSLLWFTLKWYIILLKLNHFCSKKKLTILWKSFSNQWKCKMINSFTTRVHESIAMNH